jgi:hypothetical protein
MSFQKSNIGDKVTGTKCPGTNWPGDKITRGQSDRGQSDRGTKWPGYEVTRVQSDRGQCDRGQSVCYRLYFRIKKPSVNVLVDKATLDTREGEGFLHMKK